jgi:type VI protein secretion system component Hcp
MRNLLRGAFLCAALTAANAAFAQVVVLFSVDGWAALSDRQDGMGQANSFSMGFANAAVATSGGAPVSGKPSVQDCVLTMPVGTAAIMFSRNVLNGTHLPGVTVQFAQGNNAKAPPIFQARLVQVFVTSVTFAKSGNDGGPGVAEVRLRASRIEMFNNTVDSRGAMRPGSKVGIDLKTLSTY